MSDRCKWAGSDRPRVLPGRHADDCRDDECSGCLPCPMDHCRLCSVTHAEQTCAECVGEVRDNLAEVVRLFGELPAEVEIKGINGEAMALLGPAANPEQWGHVEASIASGRLPADWQVELGHHHPLTVLAGWQDVYADAWGHENTVKATVSGAANYLGRNLDRASAEPWVPFDEMAKDVRGCVTHLKVVLSDSDRGERANIACFDCGGNLERRLTFAGFDDHWTCSKCRRRYTIAEYNFALRAKLEESA